MDDRPALVCALRGRGQAAVCQRARQHTPFAVTSSAALQRHGQRIGSLVTVPHEQSSGVQIQASIPNTVVHRCLCVCMPHHPSRCMGTLHALQYNEQSIIGRLRRCRRVTGCPTANSTMRADPDQSQPDDTTRRSVPARDRSNPVGHHRKVIYQSPTQLNQTGDRANDVGERQDAAEAVADDSNRSFRA